jgi:hypothetical protein
MGLSPESAVLATWPQLSGHQNLVGDQINKSSHHQIIKSALHARSANPLLWCQAHGNKAHRVLSGKRSWCCRSKREVEVECGVRRLRETEASIPKIWGWALGWEGLASSRVAVAVAGTAGDVSDFSPEEQC